MAIFDFLRKKKIDVTSVSGTPTISRTVCLKITSGDDSTTDTGEIVLDWTNIASKADIGVYDENDNLLDYYFETFDETDEKAVIWVFRDWVQDGSTQLQIAYGDGPSDQSAAAPSTVFSKESGLEAAYLFNETSGDLIDVSGNGNDGTVHGATQGEEGIVGGAYSFDGNGDHIEVSHDESQNITGQLSFFAWIDITSLPDSDKRYPVLSKRGRSLGDEDDDNSYYLMIGDHESDDDVLVFGFNNGSWHSVRSSRILSTGKQYIGVTFDENEVKFYLNGSLEDTISLSATLSAYSVPLYLGADPDDFRGYFTGILDTSQLFAKIVSEEEASALYNASKSSPDFFSQQAGEVAEIILDGITLEFLLGANTGVLTTSNVLQGTEVALPLTIAPGSDVSGYELTLSEVELPLTSDEGTLVSNQKIYGVPLNLALSSDKGTSIVGIASVVDTLALGLSADAGKSVYVSVSGTSLDLSISSDEGSLTRGKVLLGSANQLDLATPNGELQISVSILGGEVVSNLSSDAAQLMLGQEVIGTLEELPYTGVAGSLIRGHQLEGTVIELELLSMSGTNKPWVPIEEPILYGGSRSLSDLLACRSMSLMRTTTTQSDKLTNIDRS